MPTRAETKIWRSLRRRKRRDAHRLFLAEGPKLVEEMLDWPGRIVRVLANEETPENGPIFRLLDRAMTRGVRAELVPEKVLEAIADTESPGAVLAIGEIPDVGWGDVGRGLIVVLDGVQDPGNTGTLIRTAAALGACAVVGVGPAADPWGPKALRASAGATFKVPAFRAKREKTAAALANRDVPIWIATAKGEPLSRRIESPGALALVLGSEAHGVSNVFAQVAARTVGVKLHANVESLNVAAAGAILLDRLASD